jgi:hypothetical protein
VTPETPHLNPQVKEKISRQEFEPPFPPEKLEYFF